MSRRLILTATIFVLTLAMSPGRVFEATGAGPSTRGPVQEMGLEMNPNG